MDGPAPKGILNTAETAGPTPPQSGLSAEVLLARMQDAANWSWSNSSVGTLGTTARLGLLYRWLDLTDTEPAQRIAQRICQWIDRAGEELTPVRGIDHDSLVLTYLAAKVGPNRPQPAGLMQLGTVIRQHGGLGACRGPARFLLALFGACDHASARVWLPEQLFLPGWCPGSLERQSHWARAITVPLSILRTNRPRKITTVEEQISELDTSATRVVDRHSTLERCFSMLDRLGMRPLRGKALAAAERWIQERLNEQSGLCGSVDATVYALLALSSQGNPRYSPAIRAGLAYLGRAAAHSSTSPPGLTPSSTTGILDTAVVAQTTKGSERSAPVTRRAVEWLLQQELNPQESRVRSEPKGGWGRDLGSASGDVMATSTVLLALREQFAERPSSSLITDDSMVAMVRANSRNVAHQQVALLDRVAAASRRARLWLQALQNSDGGWGHAKKLNHLPVGRPSLTQGVPVFDVSTPATTGRTLMALGAWDMGCGQACIDQAVSYLRSTQTPEGGWPDRHNASSIESTWSAVCGLRSVGLPRRDASIVRAADWLLSRQQSDGGWSGLADQGNDAPSHPLETSWAILALAAAGKRPVGGSDGARRFLAAALAALELPHGHCVQSIPGWLNPMTCHRTPVAVLAYGFQALATAPQAADD